MTTHITGTRAQWRADRIALLKDEKDLTRRGDELARRRRGRWRRVIRSAR